MRNLILILFFLVVSCHTQGDDTCSAFIPEASDKYIFPVRPGMPEWGLILTGQGLIDACQMPSEKISKISSYGLVETCLDYPLLATMTAFDTIQYGVERQMFNFNGFHELVLRNDAGKLMLNRFKQMNPYCLPDGDIAMGGYSFDFVYLGMIQSQYVFINQLNSLERRTLLNEAITKYEQMLEIGDPYGVFSQKIVVLTMARVMLEEKYPPFLEEYKQNDLMKAFVDYAELNNTTETLNTILNYANNF